MGVQLYLWFMRYLFLMLLLPSIAFVMASVATSGLKGHFDRNIELSDLNYIYSMVFQASNGFFELNQTPPIVIH